MQHTTRALLLSIFILSGILLLPFASMGQVVITATAPGGINPLDVCGAPAHFTVKILSDDPAGIPSGVLAVQMPTGIRYVVGSAVYTKGATGNVTQSNTADPAAPVFALANIAGGDSVEIDFQAQADCRRINEPVNTNNYTVSYGGNVFSSVGDVSNPDNPAYNVRYAAMNISITSNASYSGAPGGTYTRTIRVQNGGFGAIPEMKIDVTNTSGLVVTGVTVSGASSIIANQAFPFAGGTYTLSGFGANGVFDNSDIEYK